MENKHVASHRLTQFASHVARGKPATQAARLAGYSESTARTKQHALLVQARAVGLLPSENEIRELRDMALRDLRAGLVDVVEALLAQAKAGDVPAAKEVLARVLGPVPQKHVLATMDDIAVIATELLDISARAATTDAERAFADRLTVLWLEHLQVRA
jgi:phage terminase small subunit